MPTHLILNFSKKLLLSHVVDPQRFPHASNQSPLEGHNCQGHVIRFRLVQQLQSGTRVREGICPQEPTRTRPRGQQCILAGTHNKVGLTTLGRERHNGNGERCLIVVQLNKANCSCLDGVNDTNA